MSRFGPCTRRPDLDRLLPPAASDSDRCPLHTTPQSTHLHQKDPILMGIPAARDERLLHYVSALEEELIKIQAFQRELPLSLDLVTRTIESCRRDIMEIGEERPVLEEFIPMKGSSGSEEVEKNERSEEGEAQDKAEWLRSAQLWNQHQQLEQRDDVGEGEGPVAIDGDASDAGSEGGGSDEVCDREREEQMQKKARRCWSPDLHRKFVDALQQLGGPEVATPKQIKELMNVDGLTNDEIKSHLQKHRIRSKRPAAPATPAANSKVNQQPPVLLGIWVPQGDYAAVAAAAAAAIASLPLEPKPKKQKRQKQSKHKATGPAMRPLNATSTGSNTTSV